MEKDALDGALLRGLSPAAEMGPALRAASPPPLRLGDSGAALPPFLGDLGDRGAAAPSLPAPRALPPAPCALLRLHRK